MSNITKGEKFLLPAIASAIIPGLGQIIKGHIFKAVGIWIVSILIGWFFGWWVALPGTIFYILNIIDAFLSHDSESLIK